MEVQVKSEFVLKLTSTEFRVVCAALDGRTPTGDKDAEVRKDLATRLVRMRTDGLADLADAAEHAEQMRARGEAE